VTVTYTSPTPAGTLEHGHGWLHAGDGSDRVAHITVTVTKQWQLHRRPPLFSQTFTVAVAPAITPPS